MTDIKSDPDVIKAYAKNLDAMHHAFDGLSQYVKTTACDKSGFTGLLTLLHPAVDLVDNLFQETIKFGNDRLSSLVDGMNKVAEDYEKREAKHAQSFKDIVDQVNESTVNV